MHRLYIVLLVGLVFILGCSDAKSPTQPAYTPTDSTWSDGSGGYYARLDATASGQYRYFDLDTRQVVSLSESAAATSSAWNLAFSRINGKLNGGAAGPLGVKGVDLATLGDADSTAFDSISSVPAIADDQWKEDVKNFVFSPWYDYDPVQHVLVPTRNLFVMKTATGKYAKVLVDSLINAGMPPNMGTIVLKYVYQPDGSTNLAEQAQYARLDGSDGSVFFSFATGGAVNVADPMNSTAWDIWFDAYDAKINASIHGPGTAAVYPMYLENNVFDAVTQAPSGTGQGGYFNDAIASIFGAPTVSGSEWYDYNPVVHEIVSKHHIYILKFPDATHYKLQIANYYLVVEGTPQSGWVTLRFKEL